MVVVGCRKDEVSMPFTSEEIHKSELGVMLVAFDIFSILVIWLFFYKLEVINNEYLRIIDDMNVQMKDFSIKIDDISVDKYS